MAGNLYQDNGDVMNHVTFELSDMVMENLLKIANRDGHNDLTTALVDAVSMAETMSRHFEMRNRVYVEYSDGTVHRLLRK